jgi:tRNA(fMet)-specific endonuclease VapC
LRDYLIDTQTVCYWADAKVSQHTNVCNHVNAVPDNSKLLTSVVTFGEIAFGHRIATPPDLVKQAALNKFLNEKFPKPLEITKFTPTYYSELRALLFGRYPPKGKKHRRPEQCFDRITALELGIDENDLWIASQAYEHNLVIVTNDAMLRIRDVAGQLLTVENWTDPV